MVLIETSGQIEYPETDGKPMGETDLHIDWIIQIRHLLRWRYRDQRVYVASDLLLYYEEGNPRKFVVPDGFVVLDCEPQRRRTFKTWEEGKVPHVVIEVTSRSSKREDETFKPQIYAKLRIPEYFVYDPSAEYLKPPLQGFRLANQSYKRIDADQDGSLECQQLSLRLRLNDLDLVMTDLTTGEVQCTEAEAALAAAEQQRAAAEQQRAAAEQQRAAAEQQRAAAEQQRAAAEKERATVERERAARQAAEAKVADLELELDRLRRKLDGEDC